MKLPLLAALLTALPTLAAAQQQADAVWTRFDEKQKDGEKFGYKDGAGRVRISARFGGFTSAQKFRHIMAVDEDLTQPGKRYYLLKNGRQVGRDSVYIFDYEVDCESEGKIRFRDHKKDRVGFFDSSGHAVIPAVYNYATPFYNGLALARIGARRKCWSSEEDTVQCEHLGWVGGRNVLIDARNEVLVDFLPDQQINYLNWYSLQINAAAVDTATTRSFRALNGDYYTFTDYEKEFTRWFYFVFLPAIRSGAASKVAPLCYLELAVSGKPFRGWPHVERAAFMQKFYQPVLLPQLKGLRHGGEDTNIFSTDLNQLIFDNQRFKGFLTDCGAHFKERYPAFVVVFTKPGASGQQHYEFIRTAEGYRLYRVSL